MRKWSLIAIACIIALVLAERVGAHEKIRPDGSENPSLGETVVSDQDGWFKASELGHIEVDGRAIQWVRIPVLVLLPENPEVTVRGFLQQLPRRAWTLNGLRKYVAGLDDARGVCYARIEFGVLADE